MTTHTLKIKNRGIHARGVAFSHSVVQKYETITADFPKAKRIIFKTLFYLSLAGIILSARLLFLTVVPLSAAEKNSVKIVFSPLSSIPMATPEPKLDSVTFAFMDELKKAGFQPTVLSEIDKPPLLVKGKVLSLGEDTIQVFAYGDVSLAAKARETVEEQYKKTVWRGNAHIYTKDALVIFYLGSNEHILETLNTATGTPAKIFGIPTKTKLQPAK